LILYELADKEDTEEIDVSMRTSNLNRESPVGSALFSAFPARFYLVIALAVRFMGLLKAHKLVEEM
jgi:hypothetical protein